jgi:hypothetical protein
MSGISGAIVAGGIAAAGTVTGAAISSGAAGAQADAARDTTDKQLKFAREALDKQIAERKRIEQESLGLAAKSPEELAAMGRVLSRRDLYLKQQDESLRRVEGILEKVDPSIKEAADQQLQLLRGETSKVLKPLEMQRQRQRKQLENALSERLGPGYATSSAGLQALSAFDDQSFTLMTDAQMKALTVVSDTLSRGLQTRPDMLGAQSAIFRDVMGADSTVLSAEMNATGRKVNAFQGAATVAPVDFGGPARSYGEASKNIVATTGQPAAIWGNVFTGLGNQAAGIAGQFAGAQMYKNMFGGGGGVFDDAPPLLDSASPF